MPELAPAQKADYWRAVHDLREAEALADLGTTSGPTDEPPVPGQQQSWVRDWVERARRALGRANEMASQGADAVKERAARIAQRVKRGAEAIRRANPIASAKEAVDDVANTAKAMAYGWASMNVLFTVVALVGAYWYFVHRHK